MLKLFIVSACCAPYILNGNTFEDDAQGFCVAIDEKAAYAAVIKKWTEDSLKAETSTGVLTEDDIILTEIPVLLSPEQEQCCVFTDGGSYKCN